MFYIIPWIPSISKIEIILTLLIMSKVNHGRQEACCY